MKKHRIAAIAAMVFFNTSSSQNIMRPQPQAAPSSPANTFQDPPRCIRWTWSGDVYNRTVVCLEWRKKDPDKERKK
jgi:hypothetical protein